MSAGQAWAQAARALLEEALAGACVESPAGERLPLHSELPAEEGRVLQHWFRESSASRVLEIGCAYGISSLYLCEVMAERDVGCYHVIDAFQSSEWRNVGLGHLQRARPEGGFEFHEELSELCLPRLLAQGEHYDFAFVDGWHTFDQVMLEFYYINRMLAPGGIVVFDDVHLPALQKVLAYLSAYPCYETLAPPAAVTNSMKAHVRRLAGVPAIRLQALQKIASDSRDWDWYVDF